MSVHHNARVLRPTCHTALPGDIPTVTEELERFVVYLENVQGEGASASKAAASWTRLGRAASGAGEAALCEMTLATARRLATAGTPDEKDAVKSAARAVVAFAKTRFELRAGRQLLKMGPRSLLMGIVNVTPDSFSDGGSFFDTRSAIEHGHGLAREGADIVDVGGCSTRPGAAEVPVEEELRRVLPVVEALAAELDVPISIDSYQPEVVRRALEAGATIVNDVTGLHVYPELAGLAAEHGAAMVVMHMKGTPRTMQKDPVYRDLMSEVSRYLREAVAVAQEAGLGEDRVVVDPGFGFGKTVAHNLELLRRLGELRSLGLPIMVGTSRKSTIGKVLGTEVDQRTWGTAATVAVARAAGAMMFRVHDVAQMDQVRRMTDAVFGG